MLPDDSHIDAASDHNRSNSNDEATERFSEVTDTALPTAAELTENGDYNRMRQTMESQLDSVDERTARCFILLISMIDSVRAEHCDLSREFLESLKRYARGKNVKKTERIITEDNAAAHIRMGLLLSGAWRDLLTSSLTKTESEVERLKAIESEMNGDISSLKESLDTVADISPISVVNQIVASLDRSRRDITGPLIDLHRETRRQLNVIRDRDTLPAASIDVIEHFHKRLEETIETAGYSRIIPPPHYDIMEHGRFFRVSSASGEDFTADDEFRVISVAGDAFHNEAEQIINPGHLLIVMPEGPK